MLGAALQDGVFAVAFFGYGPLYMRETLGWAHLSEVTLTTGIASLVAFVTAAAWGRLGDRTGRPLALIATGLALAAALMVALSLTRQMGAFITEVVVAAAVLAAVPGLGPAWLTLRHPDSPAQAAAEFYRARTAGWFVGSLGIGLCVRAYGIAALAQVLQAVAAWSALVAAGLVAVRRRRAPSGVRGRAAGQAEGLTDVETARPALSPTHGVAGTADPASVTAEAGGRRRAWRNPAVWSAALCVLFIATASEVFLALLGPYLTEYLRGPTEYVGVSLAASGLLGMAVLGWVGRLADRHGPHRVLRAAALGYVVIFALTLVIRDPLATAIIYTLPMYPLLMAGATGWLAYRTPSSQRGEAVGICEGTASLAAALGAVASGLVADQFGLAWVPAASLLSASVGLAIAWFLIRPGATAAAALSQVAAGR